MARSHVGKVKLAVSQLERREVKLLRRKEALDRAITANKELLRLLREALAMETVTREGN